MSILFKVRENLANSYTLDLHFLPAKVNGDGTTDVNNYFNSYTSVEHDGILTNAVRGFPLKGETLEVPETHKAFILQESQKPLNAENRNLYVTGNFEKFCYWNYDKIPTKADTYKQALQLLDICEEFTASISDTSLQAEIEKKRRCEAKENTF
ncbi:uncharacterized protein LOC129245101 [Anastrepha obliqua]|uniref:uncharacterized protein LOC129245101 n=1 Tax=Anastrepha obliqua TaxID=95512 RepID=UPI0024095B87|nr:uncharacterized protein LOC129245101 [Anastrepha obliqua]